MNLTTFAFDGQTVRTVTGSDGSPLFCGRDVADALGYRDTVNAMKQHCKGVAIHHPLQTAGGVQQARFISEPDVMRLIVGSKLPAAERFERWVFEEVLPTIRRTGSYGVTAPKDMIEALTQALEQARQLEAQKAIIAEQAVSVAALDRIAGTDGTMPPTSAAKVLKIAPMELIRWLDANGWTYLQGGERRAYSERIKSGDLVQVLHEIGEGRSKVQVRVTAAGVAKLAKRLPKGGQMALGVDQ